MSNHHVSTSLYQSPWFHVQKRVENPTVRLFCFSYAGGSASTFRDWCNQVPNGVEICSVQLPGRGTRFREPSLTSMNLLLDALVQEFTPHCHVPFAFFGHSMGAQVAFEFTRRLRQCSEMCPVQLFVSGRCAPQINSSRRPIHRLSEKDFIEEIKKLNGTPDEALQHPELMELVSPILRADIKLIETWKYIDDEPLEVPITAFGGIDDGGVTARHLEDWGYQTCRDFSMQLFEGDHFFINTSRVNLLNTVSGILSPIVRSYAGTTPRLDKRSRVVHVA